MKLYLFIFTMLLSVVAKAEYVYQLPLELALKAANAAIKSCEAKAYKVTVVVVDTSGETRVLLKNNGSSVHTKDTSFRKAYTVVTLGPIFDLSTSSEIANMIIGKPSESSFVVLPNVVLMPGAVAIKVKGSIVAALGVGGAPGGDKDEACAAEGVKAISADLPKV